MYWAAGQQGICLPEAVVALDLPQSDGAQTSHLETPAADYLLIYPPW
jgi:hypothetical protein